MFQKSSYLRKSFFIWIFANILGICAAAGIPLLLTTIRFPQNVVLSVFIFCIPISLAQWLALWHISHISILWVLTIPVGILLYFLINRLIPAGLSQIFDDESIFVLTATYTLIGFLVGLLQWFILRRQFSGSSLWLFGSSVALGFSFWLILITNLINRNGIIAFIVGVLTYTFITGLILTRLLAKHINPRLARPIISNYLVNKPCRHGPICKYSSPTIENFGDSY